MKLLIRIVLITALFLCAVPSMAQTTTRFITLADIHFDPFSACQGKKPCAFIKQLQDSKVEDWDALLTKADTTVPHYGGDTNITLLKSALTAAKLQAHAADAQAVVVLGDMLSHNFRTSYRRYSGDRSLAGFRNFVIKTLAYLQIQLQAAFGERDILPVLGNNDSWQNDYVVDNDGGFYRAYGALWAKSMHDATARQAFSAAVAQGGYYALTRDNTRFIILNSTPFSRRATGEKVVNVAEQEWTWLANQLQSAQKSGQRAVLFMHIPPRLELFFSLRIRLFTLFELWSKPSLVRFDTLMQAYAPLLDGVFTAHIHNDSLQLHAYGKGVYVPFVGSPAISPIFASNPGFKLYGLNNAAAMPLDFISYYARLHARNSKRGVQADFAQYYPSVCSACIHPAQDSFFARLARESRDLFFLSDDIAPEHLVWRPTYRCDLDAIARLPEKLCLS